MGRHSASAGDNAQEPVDVAPPPRAGRPRPARHSHADDTETTDLLSPIRTTPRPGEAAPERGAADATGPAAGAAADPAAGPQGDLDLIEQVLYGETQPGDAAGDADDATVQIPVVEAPLLHEPVREAVTEQIPVVAAAPQGADAGTDVADAAAATPADGAVAPVAPAGATAATATRPKRFRLRTKTKGATTDAAATVDRAAEAARPTDATDATGPVGVVSGTDYATITEPKPPAKPAPAPPPRAPAAASPASRRSTSSHDLDLLRTRPDIRARAVAAVVVPLVVYVIVLLVIGSMAWRPLLIWVWVPLVTAGVLVGLVLDQGHRTPARAPDPRPDDVS